MVSFSEINNPEVIAIEHDPVRRIAMIANTNWNKLNDCRLYLNDKGKTMKEVYSTIENACEFADTIEKLKTYLQEEIDKTRDDAVKRRLHTFAYDILKQVS